MEQAHPSVALPDVVHCTVELAPTTARVVIVGDVHACFDELQALLQACAFDAEHDQLVFVGDLVNKGPKPVEVVRFARESNALCVRGNHDDAALAAYYAWQASGRVAGESNPKYSYVEQLSRDDVQFLEQLPFTLTLPAHNTIVVHAGLVPGVALPDQRPIDMYKMRFLTQREADGTIESSSWQALESRSTATHTSSELYQWATQWRGPEHVVFGHDAVAGLQREAFATGLDTGCCYGRQLSACILPSREIVQVPAMRAYVAVPDSAATTATTATAAQDNETTAR